MRKRLAFALAGLLAVSVTTGAGAAARGPAPAPRSADEGTVTAAELLAKVQSCSQISNGEYGTDGDTEATIPVCGANGAVFWNADMDVDCDGQVTSLCNKDTDPWFQDDTAFHQSDGKPLIADTLPYVVVPSPSSTWDYRQAGIKGGGVVAVIYNNQVQYAVVGDVGPAKSIGEASYATADALGINPDPTTGGAGSGVTYILFKDSSVSPIENHDEAVSLGNGLAEQFVQNN